MPPGVMLQMSSEADPIADYSSGSNIIHECLVSGESYSACQRDVTEPTTVISVIKEATCLSEMVEMERGPRATDCEGCQPVRKKDENLQA